MLMSSNKDKMASTIIAGMNKKPDAEAPMSEDNAESDDSVGMDSAAEELLAAIESKSPKAIVEAFKSMMDMYSSQPEEPPQE